MVARHNLPRELTSFVGRERDVPEIARLLETAPLVTLTGPGGTGKTRLALRVASEIAQSAPAPQGKEEATPLGLADGVWLVELASLADETLVPHAITTVVGVPHATNGSILATLVDALGPKHLLLVLDNCEHLIDACASTVTELIRACAGLRILATSREALNVEGERVWRVPSLSLPDQHRAARAGEVLAHEAVRLFAERASAAQPDFAVTDHNAATVAQLCRRLDGVPLAIELASARLHVLTVEQILARLEDRFRLLTGGKRTALERQQTLEATVAWSYDLLSPPEQILFRRLSAFDGSLTLEAAEAVGGEDEEPRRKDEGGIDPSSFVVRRTDVLDLLGRLVDKSMVIAEPDTLGETRYRLLETLRAYGRLRLVEAGEAKAVQRAQAEYYVAFGEAARPEIETGDQVAWLTRLRLEHDNLRQALRHLIESRETESALRLTSAICRYWYFSGTSDEGRGWLAQALELPDAASYPAAHAAALFASGFLASLAGDFGEKVALCERSLAIQRAIGDTLGAAWSLQVLGFVAQMRGAFEQARALHEESLALRRAGGDRWGESFSLTLLGQLAEQLGDLPSARRLHEECLAIRRHVGDRIGESVTLGRLAVLTHLQGDRQASDRFWQDQLSLGRTLGEEAGWATSLHPIISLVFASLTAHDRARAETMLSEAISLVRDRQEPSRHLVSLLWLAGIAACDRGDLAAAQVFFTDQLALETQPEYALEGLGVVAAALGHPERGLQLCAAAAHPRRVRMRIAHPLWQEWLKRRIDDMRGALGASQIETALAAGAAMSLNEAITLAREWFESTRVEQTETSHSAAQGRQGGLSERERQVAALVAQGMTNRQIAKELVIAESTAARHIEHILAKLQLTSRVQIAAWATSHGAHTGAPTK